MKTCIDEKPIKALVEIFKSRMMIANPEYQRGVVWNEAQQKRLIDSLFRGFTLLSLPFIPWCLPTTARLSGTDIILSQWIL